MSKKITAKDACALILVSSGNSIKNGTTLLIPRISHINAKDPKKRAIFPIFLFIKLLFKICTLFTLHQGTGHKAPYYGLIF